MLERGWLQCGNDVADQMISFLNFFGVATPEQWADGWTEHKLAFKKATNVTNHIGAVSAWLRQGEVEGHKINCQSFNKERLLSSIDKIRQLTLADPQTFIPQLQNICADCGIAIIFLKPFQTVSVYSASYWLNPDKALIQLSLRRKTADILWFNFFHALGHIIKHSKKAFFIEIDGKCESKSTEELEADQYASETLIPSIYLNQWLEGNPKLNVTTISTFAKKMNISPSIVVGRLQHLNLVKYSALNELKIRYDWQQ